MVEERRRGRRQAMPQARFIMKSVIRPLIMRTGRFPVLTVEGRTSGRPRSVPIGEPLELDGRRYPVSAGGQSHWILNLRSAGRGTLRLRGTSESFRAVEVISHSICLTVGGVGRKPGFGRGGLVEAREVVCLTISVDHDVVNGAPVARFISRLRESIETAGLLASD